MWFQRIRGESLVRTIAHHFSPIVVIFSKSSDNWKVTRAVYMRPIKIHWEIRRSWSRTDKIKVESERTIKRLSEETSLNTLFNGHAEIRADAIASRVAKRANCPRAKCRVKESVNHTAPTMTIINTEIFIEAPSKRGKQCTAASGHRRGARKARRNNIVKGLLTGPARKICPRCRLLLCERARNPRLMHRTHNDARFSIGRQRTTKSRPFSKDSPSHVFRLLLQKNI